MPAPTASQDRARLAILAPGSRAGLAADLVADHLGMTRTEVAARILRGPGVLIDKIDRRAAQRVAVMLHLMGVRARIEDCTNAPDHVARFDMVLQEMPGGIGPGVLTALSQALGCPQEEVARQIAAPTGVCLTGLDWDRVCLWRRAMPRLSGLRMVISDPETARHDLMPLSAPRDRAEPARLARSLAVLGLAPCGLTGAVACDLDRAQCDHLMRRHPGAGVLAMNRDFQRFDLLLIGCDGLSRGEMADFLSARTCVPRATLERSGPATPVPIERGLTRGQALSFHAEYAAIGLQTRLRLVGGPGAPAVGPVRLSP